MKQPRKNLGGILMALLGFAIWSTHDVFIKSLGESYSPIQIVFFSVLFGFPFLTLVMMRDAEEHTLIPRHPGWTAIRTVAAVTTGICAFYAFSVLPLAQVYALLFAMPLLITILAIPILGERVGWRRWLAVIVGLGGVMVVLQPGVTPLELGHIAALIAAVTGAIASVIMRKIGREERTVVMMLYPMVANFILMGGALALVYEPMPIIDLGKSVLVSVLAILALGAVIAAYRNAPAALVAPMQYSQILWATLYGALLFDETIDRTTLIGSAIIIASGLYIVLREARGPNSATKPVLRTRSRAAAPSAPRVSAFLSDTDRRVD